jgi:hypothetical protein
MRWTRQRRAHLGSQGGSSVSDQGAPDERRQSPYSLFDPPKSAFGRRRLAKTGGCVRQNRVVLAPVAGVKSAEVLKAQPGFRKTANSPTTVTRRIRRRGERGISRKTIAQGMPGCSDCTCMLVCVSSHNFAHETAGAASTRRSLRPLLDGRNDLQSSGETRRGNADLYLGTVIASAAKQSISPSKEEWIASLRSQ